MLEPNILAKYAAGAGLIGSVLYLTIIGTVPAEQYILIVSGALAALGITAQGGK